MTSNVSIDLTDPDVAKLFESCKPGEEVTLKLTVEDKTDTQLSGSLDSVEGKDDAGESEYAGSPEDGGDDEASDKTMGAMPGGRKMPPGLTIILGHTRGKA